MTDEVVKPKLKKYPKIYEIGHSALVKLFDGPVEITEKVDGSQFRIYFSQEEFDVGSKNQTGLEVVSSNKMFELACTEAKKIYKEGRWKKLGKEVTLFCEYLYKNKSNTLTYDTIPSRHFYLFGAIIDEKHQTTKELIGIAKLLGIDPPNVLFEGEIKSKEQLEKLMKTESYLGGTIIEGIVIKNYTQTYPIDLLSTAHYVGFPLAGKFVCPAFREKNDRNWARKKESKGVDGLCKMYLTEQRFLKAVQHLKEEGKLEFQKKDLKYLIPEFYNDLISEEKENITKKIMDEVFEELKRRATNFVVHQYIDYLAKRQFEMEEVKQGAEGKKLEVEA